MLCNGCKLHNSGVSGPAALKLSAFGARELHDNGYKGQVKVNWMRAAVANEAEALEAFKKVLPTSICVETSVYVVNTKLNHHSTLHHIL
jgi:ABC-type sulfate transport system substrate-binding protein